jgi:hypothetical protein
MRGNPYQRSKAKNSRLSTIVDKWRGEFNDFTTEELNEIQEVIDLILDERFFTRRRG